MKNRIIGIDLGLNGGFSLLVDGKLIKCLPTPVTTKTVNKKERNVFDIEGIIEILKSFSHGETIACMERLRPMPSQYSQTGFSLGYGSGIVKGILTVLGIEYVEVEPRQWQDWFFPKKRNKGKTKELSIKAALRKFPGNDFKRTKRSKVPSDGLTDSALIGLYLYEKAQGN